MLPAVPALLLEEPERKAGTYLGSLLQTKQEFQSTFLKRGNLPGLLLLLSPIGTGQVANVLTGLTEQYHASAGELSSANGWGAGIATACGTLLMLLLRLHAGRGDRVRCGWGGLCHRLPGSGKRSFVPQDVCSGMLASNFAQGFCWSAHWINLVSHGNTGPFREQSLHSAWFALLRLYNLHGLAHGRVIQTYGPRSLGLFDAAANIASQRSSLVAMHTAIPPRRCGVSFTV